MQRVVVCNGFGDQRPDLRVIKVGQPVEFNPSLCAATLPFRGYFRVQRIGLNSRMRAASSSQCSNKAIENNDLMSTLRCKSITLSSVASVGLVSQERTRQKSILGLSLQIGTNSGGKLNGNLLVALDLNWGMLNDQGVHK